MRWELEHLGVLGFLEVLDHGINLVELAVHAAHDGDLHAGFC